MIIMSLEQKDLEVFKPWLNSILTDEIVQVTFEKSDGTDRIMKCTLKEELVTPYEKKTNRTRKQNEDVCVVFDTDKQEWRSFRYDTVKSVSFGA